MAKKYWVALPDKKNVSTRDEIIHYLKDQVSKGHNYFKSKYIAEDLNNHPKRIGQILYELSQNSKKQEAFGIKVKSWSRSLSTTWHIVAIV
jgi:hypothetical protein